MGIVTAAGVLGLLVAGLVLLVGARRAAVRIAALCVGVLIAAALLPAGCSLLTAPRDQDLRARPAPEGGWSVDVPAAANADRYVVLVDGTRAATLKQPGTIHVNDVRWSQNSYAPGPVRRLSVQAFDGSILLRTSSAPVCPPVVILAARGTGENPGKAQFAHGIGSRSWRTWGYLVEQLGLSPTANVRSTVVTAAPVQYPAALFTARGYAGSRDAGKDSLRAMWSEVRDTCPNTVIVASGYSQGADVVASIWQEEGTSTDNVAGVVLFADPHFNRQWVRQGIVFPSKGRFEKDGLLGARPLFHGDRVNPVQAWCWPADPVCQALPRPWSWHGPAYDCYERFAAYRLASEVKDHVRDAGYPVAEPVVPTCTLDTRGR